MNAGKYESLPIDKIKPYDRNPRRIPENAVDAVAESIKQFGFQQPIVIDKDGVVIAGHTRLLAAQKLGLNEVPVKVADNLTPEQVKAYRLADNKTGELADWDFEKLTLELDEIDMDMEQFGFEDTEPPDISDMFDQPEKEDKKESKFLVIVECLSEEEQKDICQKLEAEGLTVYTRGGKRNVYE